MNATRTTKQTAGNNATLKAVRKLMNDAIYRTFAAIYNASGEGCALRWMSQYFNAEGWTRVLETIPRARTRATDASEEPR
jgi:hypothetical protein